MDNLDLQKLRDDIWATSTQIHELSQSNETFLTLRQIDAGLQEQTDKEKSEQLEQMKQYHGCAQKQGDLRMRALGLQNLGTEDVPQQVVQENRQIKKDAQYIYQMEQSGKKKRAQQEEDATVRAGDEMVQNMKRCAAQSAGMIQKTYEKKKEDQTPIDQTIPKGSEFVIPPNGEIDPEGQANAIANLLLQRDKYAKWLETAPQNTISEKAGFRFNQEYVEYINDAVKTWKEAGGYNEKGKRISERAKKAAQQHLPLAIEKYTYHIGHMKDIVTGYEVELLKNTDSYKKEYETEMEAALQNGKNAHFTTVPIAGPPAQALSDLRLTILARKEEYEQNKPLVDSLYEELLQHWGEMTRMTIEQSAAQNADILTLEKRSDIKKWRDRHGYEYDLHEFTANGIVAYIEYLLKGSKPSPEAAMYIEKRFQVSLGKIGGQMKPSEEYGDDQGYNERINARIAELYRDESLPEKMKQDAIEALIGVVEKKRPQNEKAEMLVRYSANGLKQRIFAKTSCVVPEMEAVIGCRDLVRECQPLEEAEIKVDGEYVKSLKKNLYQLQKGTHYPQEEGEKIPCTTSDYEEGVSQFTKMLTEAKQDVESYMKKYPEAFSDMSIPKAYKWNDQLTTAYKKVQGMRDTCGAIVKTKGFYEVSEEARKQIIDLWDFSGALTDLLNRWSTIPSDIGNATLAELDLENGDAAVSLKKTYEDWLEGSRKAHANIIASRKSRMEARRN